MATANTAKQVPHRLVAQLATRRRAVCLRCQYRAVIAREGLIPSYSLTKTRGYASESTVQRWRKKLWGGKQAEQKEQPAVETEPEDEGYTPATTWDGLQRVGGRPSLEEFEKGHRWEEGFMLPTKLQSKDDILTATYRALTEVFTLRQAGLPFIIQSQLGDDRDLEAAHQAILRQEKDGSVQVEYPDEASRETVITALTTDLPEEEESREEGVEEAKEEGSRGPETEVTTEQNLQDKSVTNSEDVKQAGQLDERDDDFFEPDEQPGNESMTRQPVPVENWIKTSFPDPAVKFAILKRVMQLTGHRIPDPAIQDINSAKALVGQLVRKPKPKKLAERLTANGELSNLPNVKLRERRWTPIDKEKEVGRWKVIEEELRKRDLPITGHGVRLRI
ncbi:MAG: hypothetical protein Q9191_000720 [Dirinaria sp. TL-2023a]